MLDSLYDGHTELVALYEEQVCLVHNVNI